MNIHSVIRRLIILSGVVVFAYCSEPEEKTVTPARKKINWAKPAKDIQYQFTSPEQWLLQHANAAQQKIVMTVNRTDSTHLLKMDSILVPDDLSGDLPFYLPFPLSVPAAKDVEKIIFFSYPSQSFAAYEYGELVYAGPSNMGRKADPTPQGLYYTNWKAEQTTSTFNDEWELKWNFNIENKKGIGFHQYELPGYPASHSCLRLLEDDAKFLYKWADEWILASDEVVAAKGTPVIVFGTYAFDAPKPWLQLANDPHALDISAASLDQTIAAFLQDILQQQQKRAVVVQKQKK